MNAVSRIYGRAFDLVRSRPWLILLPVLAEWAQHVVEIRVGMYAGGMDAAGRSARLGFGIAKLVVLFCTIIMAWRLWSFDGHVGRALRPTLRLFRGVGTFVLVQIVGNLSAFGIGLGLVALVDEPAPPTRIMLTTAPLLAWLLASAALFPWYVALATEDRSMTLRRSLRASRGRLLATWGLLVAGYLPLTILHYGIGYAALHGAPVWPLMLLDGIVVGCLAAAFAATYYTIYRKAQERLEHAAEDATH